MTTWAAARAALKTKFHGQTVTATGFDQETLTCAEFPPNGLDQPVPFAFFIPPARDVSRLAGDTRMVRIAEVRLRVLLGADNQEEAAQRMEAWVTKLTDLVGDAISAEGTTSVVVLTQQFTEFSTYGLDGAPPYGFDMVLGVNVVGTETRSA